MTQTEMILLALIAVGIVLQIVILLRGRGGIDIDAPLQQLKSELQRHQQDLAERSERFDAVFGGYPCAGFSARVAGADLCRHSSRVRPRRSRLRCRAPCC